MIVKIQIPVSTNEKVPMALVYNKDRSFMTQIPCKPEWIKTIMRNRLKAYFEVSAYEDGIEIIRELDDQPW